MSIVINGIKMPEAPDEIVYIAIWGNGTVIQTGESWRSPEDGRCIDADVLNYTMLYKENWMSGTGVEAPAVWKKDIDACPTIIPAEPKEEETK